MLPNFVVFRFCSPSGTHSMSQNKVRLEWSQSNGQNNKRSVEGDIRIHGRVSPYFPPELLEEYKSSNE